MKSYHITRGQQALAFDTIMRMPLRERERLFSVPMKYLTPFANWMRWEWVFWMQERKRRLQVYSFRKQHAMPYKVCLMHVLCAGDRAEMRDSMIKKSLRSVVE